MRLTPLFALGQRFSWVEALGTVIFVLVIFLVVMYLAYVASKLVGKRYSAGGRNLQLIETMSIAPNKQLYIVRAADKTFLLASSKDGVTCLGELDGDKLVAVQNTDEPLDFAAALRKAAQERFAKNKKQEIEKGAEEDET